MHYDIQKYSRGNYFGFPRKEDLRSHISKVVSWSVQPGMRLESNNETMMLALLDMHPRAAEKKDAASWG